MLTGCGNRLLRWTRQTERASVAGPFAVSVLDSQRDYHPGKTVVENLATHLRILRTQRAKQWVGHGDESSCTYALGRDLAFS